MCDVIFPMRQTLFVTIKGPQRAIDIEVPGDVPVRSLLPLFQRMCGLTVVVEEGRAATSTGYLSIVGYGGPLTGSLTLFDHQVLDGDVLLLTQDHPAAVSRRVSRGLPETIHPSAETGMIGVAWTREELL
jgi:hypothetical protein